MFKGKPFPYYKELCIVFGKHGATGKDAKTPVDVIEELDKEEEYRATNTVDEQELALEALMPYCRSCN